ncbi:MAG: beta-ketoacyl synthase chain length factor [Fluviicola sp.]|nr:beta-ketoacyl synthase chain length factor [Fluviicola sp.]
MYITDLKAISPQKSYTDELLQGEFRVINEKTFTAIEPDYSSFIPKSLLRRMGKAVRMGIGAGLPLIEKHKDIDGILIGTANGGIDDCFKFLHQIIEYDEGRLTPTNFVQSTPNAVAGQLALINENHGYNSTYTNGGLSFESALLDALLLFEEGGHNKLLVGALDEFSEKNYNIDFLTGKYKKEIVSSDELIQSKTKGTVCGEGATLFVLEKEAEEYLAKIVDVAQISHATEDDLQLALKIFLKKNNLEASEIDTLMLGYNGDINHNKWYELVASDSLKHCNLLLFKNLCGDYRTCSAFATWISAHILKGNLSDLSSIQVKSKNSIENNYILIYNHFDEVNHSFILLSK